MRPNLTARSILFLSMALSACSSSDTPAQASPGADPAEHDPVAAPPAGNAPAENGTRVVRYQPSPPSGAAAVDASCFSESLAAPGRTDARRCTIGNEIEDPCFQVDATHLVCAPDPSVNAPGTYVQVAEPLPLPATPPEMAPNAAWLLRLANGTVCTYATGATGVAEGQRLEYSCTDERWILGHLTSGTTWTAVVVAADEGPDGFQVTSRETASIATVWR